MESTFVLQPSELDNDFLESLKKLFRHTRQLQITVSASEDFGLLQNESPTECLKRLEQNLADLKQHKNVIALSEAELDGFILQKL